MNVIERASRPEPHQRPPLTIVQIIPQQAGIATRDYPFIEGESVVLTMLAPETKVEAVIGPKLAGRLSLDMGEAVTRIGGVDVAGPADVEQVAKARAATDRIRRRR